MSKTKQEVVIPPGRLWPCTPSGSPLNIEVFGATGEFQSGKTLLGLSIAPGCHPEWHKFAGKPRALLLDFEKSAGTYGGTGCHRLDVPTEMMQIKQNYSPLDVFEWFLNLISKIEPGQFDLIMADPITDIESGLVEYVKKNCDKFGFTKNQIDRSGGLLWGAVKDYWKQVLLKLSAVTQCFYFTSHLRDVWAGNTPTNKREPKGKETLMELASLYLWLERKADDKGALQAAPSAIVLKQRLADTVIDPDSGLLNIINLLPPRLPVATAAAIRRYIAAPPDYSKLKDAEKVIEQAPTEYEMEQLRLARAQVENETEVSRLEQMRRKAELQAMSRTSQGEQPVPPDKTTQLIVDKADAKAKAAAAQAAQAAIDEAKAKAEAGLAEAKKLEQKLVAETPPEHQNTSSGNASNAVDAAKGLYSKQLATQQQISDVKDIWESLVKTDSAKYTREKLIGLLSKVNAKSVADMPTELCARLIETLNKELAKANAGANVPFDA